MSGNYLADLLALATGQAAVVEPRQPQRFEPDGAVADPFAAAITEEIATPAGDEPQWRRVPSVRPATAPPLIMQEDAPPAIPSVTANPAPHDTAAVQPARVEAAAAPVGIRLPASDPQPRHMTVPPARRVQGDVARPTPAPEPPRSDTRQHPSPPEPPQPISAALLATPAGARPPQAPPAGIAQRFSPPSAAIEPAAEPPSITIRIDRIDIHAPVPPAQPRPGPSRAAAAPTDLAAYLARRREGGW